MGCDGVALGAFDIAEQFQSTHPVWDATAIDVLNKLIAQISIHASRMGCDTEQPTRRNAPAHFNPRIPYGMRP